MRWRACRDASPRGARGGRPGDVRDALATTSTAPTPRARRGRRGAAERLPAARRGARALARGRRHGRPDARAGVAAVAGCATASARSSPALRRRRASCRRRCARASTRWSTPRPTARPSARRLTGATGRRDARCSPAAAAGRGVAAAAPRTRDEVRDWQGDVFDLVQPRGGRQADDRALGLVRRQRRRPRRDARGVRADRRPDRRGGRRRRRHLGGGAAGARGAAGRPGGPLLADRAREMLLERTRRLLREESARFPALLDAVAPEPEAGTRLRDASRRSSPPGERPPRSAAAARSPRPLSSPTAGWSPRRGGRARRRATSRRAARLWPECNGRGARRPDGRRQVDALQPAGGTRAVPLGRAPPDDLGDDRRRGGRRTPDCSTGSTSAHVTRSMPARPRPRPARPPGLRLRRGRPSRGGRPARPMVDLLVWVVDPQKYADAALHERYLRPLAGHAAAMLVVLNQVDLLGGQGAARDDLRGCFAARTWTRCRSSPSPRARGGHRALREAVEERVRSRAAALARLAADVRRVPGPQRADRHGPAAGSAGATVSSSRRAGGGRGAAGVVAAVERRTGTAARWPPGCPGWLAAPPATRSAPPARARWDAARGRPDVPAAADPGPARAGRLRDPLARRRRLRGPAGAVAHARAARGHAHAAELRDGSTAPSPAPTCG